MTLAPDPIDAPQGREETRLVCIYQLTPPGEPAPALPVLLPDEVLDLGRFRSHFHDARPALGLTAGPAARPMRVESEKGVVLEAAAARMLGVAVPHGGTLLLLVLDFAEDVAGTIAVLQETCFARDSLRLEGLSLQETLSADLPAELRPAFATGLDADVHQVLMPGAALRAELGAEQAGDRDYDEATLMRLVYREDRAFRPGTGDLRKPPELNRPRATACRHARGVTVLDGAAEHVEWAVVLVACELLSGLGQLRRTRQRAAEALVQAQATERVRSTRRSALREARLSHARLSRELGDLEVELSFGVEQYLDTLRVPEIVLQSYRDSLARTLGLAGGAETTTAMLTRLKSVLDSRSDDLAAAEHRGDDIGRTAWAATLTYTTVVGIPAGTAIAKAGLDPLFLWLALLGAVGPVVYGGSRWWLHRRRDEP